MACGSVFDAFRVATEYLGPEVYRLASFIDPMLQVVPRSIFAPHTGLTHSVFRIEKNEPTAEEVAGTSITLSNGSNSGACAVEYSAVSIGFSEFTFTPVRLAWKGPLFCKDDQYFNHSPDEFINGYVNELAGYVQHELNNHLHYHYVRRVPIYIANSTCFTVSYGPSSTLTAPVPTSELTQENLDTLAQRLIWNRATNPDSAGFITLGDSGPVFSLLIGLEMSQLIALNNAEFRQDLRYADASLLMKRIGAGRVIKNFRHVQWATPARYTHNGVNFVRVPTYLSAAVTKGTGTNINPAWISPSSAPYEEAVVLSPQVMTSELIKPNSRVGAIDFPDTNYSGEWMWKTGPEAIAAATGDACYDPMHKQGRHFAEFMHGLRPGALPVAGAAIFFKRCSAACTLVTCS